MSERILDVANLSKYFKTKGGMLHAVDNVSFSLEAGKTLGVVGESGCGKSTLGRTTIRLIEPTSGDIRFKGESITKLNRREMKKRRTDMQMIFQDPFSSLNPRMSVISLIMDPMRVNHLYASAEERYKKARELMDTVGLARRVEGSYPHELDGGRRQRIGIARALALNPEFIVCDEPVSALDVSIQAQILNLLMDLQDSSGLTYMFITHDMSVVKHISDEIMVMYMGQCVEKASSDKIFENTSHPYTKALLSAIPVPSIEWKGKEPQILRGEVSSPINPKKACRFAPRCELCKEQCMQAEPEMKELEPGHFVKCHLAGSAT